MLDISCELSAAVVTGTLRFNVSLCVCVVYGIRL